MTRFIALSWFCVLMTGLSPAFARAQSLDGQIRDSRTHATLSFVKVELLYRGVRVGLEYTDQDGRFSFGIVEPGPYTISATLAGYSGVALAVDMISESGHRIDLELNRPAAPVQRGAPVVSLSEYMIPEAAKKEFARARKELDREDCVKAIKHLENGLRLFDQSPGALNELGNCRRKLGDLQSAEAAFKRAMALSDKDYIAMNLAETLTAQQRFSEAESMLKEVIGKTAENGYAYYALAVAYFKQERLDEAEAAALQSDFRKHLPDLHLLLGKIYSKTDPPRVVSQLETYLKEAPNGAQSKTVRELLKTARQG